MDKLTKEKYSKLFLIGAIWNLYIGGSGILMPKLAARLVYRSNIQADFPVVSYLSFLTNALIYVYGIGYYLVSKDPEQNRGIVWMGILGKLAFFFNACYFYSKKLISPLCMFLCFGDFVFAILFSMFLAKTKDEVKGRVQAA